MINSLTSAQKTPPPPKRAPTTVIPGDSIVKNVYRNNITKSMKHKKHVVVKHFSGAKTDDMYHYTKPTQKNHQQKLQYMLAQTTYSVKKNLKK